jgi:IS5 family transposase
MMKQMTLGDAEYAGKRKPAPDTGVDDDSGLVHSVVVTAANVADLTQVDKLLHRAENVVCADAGHTGVKKRVIPKCASEAWQRTLQMVKLFALSNLWMARRHLLSSAGEVRP